MLCFAWLLLSSIATCAWLRCSPQSAIFVTMCLTALCLFWGALCNQLLFTSQLLTVVGPSLGIAALINQRTWSRIQTDIRPYLPWFLLIVTVAYAFSRKQTLSSIDEPIYWAIVGKYLYLFDHLPVSDDLILAKHLRYLPGLGLIHYHFYQIAGHYDLQLAFFSQGTVLLSALLFFITQPRNHTQMVLLLIAFFSLHLFFGTVLARLDVDYLLAAVFLIILQHILTTKPLTLPLEQQCAILMLPLIKIPGFYFALVALFLYYQAYRIEHTAIKGSTLCVILGLLIFNQLLWQHYANVQNLGHFRAPLSWQEVQQAFLPNPTMQRAILFFLHDVFLGPADRLKIPYLFWYVLIGFLIPKIIQHHGPNQLNTNKKAQQRFFILLFTALLLYGIQLYGLQFFAFGLGSTRQEVVGLTRYWNAFFAPILLAILLGYLQKKWSFSFKRPISLYSIWLISACSLLAFHLYHTHKLQTNYTFANQLAIKTAPILSTITSSKIFLLTAYEKDNIDWQLNYHLLALQHHYHSSAPLTDPNTQKLISKNQYLLVYQHPQCRLLNGLYRIDSKHYPNAYCGASNPMAGLTLLAPL